MMADGVMVDMSLLAVMADGVTVVDGVVVMAGGGHGGGHAHSGHGGGHRG